MKNPIVTISLICSLLGLTLIYIAATSIKPKFVRLDKINYEMVGKSVTTSGYISYVRHHPAGHVFLTLSKGKSKVQVPLFAGFLKSLEKVKIYPSSFKRGKKLEVSGLVGEYKGMLQVIPRKPEDIRLIE
ncbi:MAG TPA: hypothetical protein ENG45_00480 [Candidatus Aenigmarchaeota archaeon]|nr:hypothetical protein [Candidatus Aenigmarchaeota archaeon]